MILHYAPDNASLCVRLALLTLGLPFDTVLVDRSIRAQDSAAYRAVNPHGLIPALQTPDGPMFETGAILLWLADKKPGTIFPAADAPARAPALSWLFWASNTLHPALRMLFYPEHYAKDAPQALHDDTRRRLHQLLSQLDQHWQGQPALMHCYIAPMLRWCALYGDDTAWFDLSAYPQLHAFTRAFDTAPAASRAAQDEGLGPTPFSAPILPNPPEGSAT